MKLILGLFAAVLAFDLPVLEARLSVESMITPVDEAESRFKDLPDTSDFPLSSLHSTTNGRNLSSREWSAAIGQYLDVGQLVSYGGNYYWVRQGHPASTSFPPDVAHSLFALQAINAAWVPWTWYYLGYAVTFGGSTYRCIHSHVSQPDWNPTNAPSLWELTDASDLELVSRGLNADAIDTADAILDLFSQIEAQMGPALGDVDLTPFEVSLYGIVPDLQAFICAMNGRVPLTQAEVNVLVNNILNNPAIALLDTLSDTGTTAGAVKAYLANNKAAYEHPLYDEFQAYLSALGDGEIVSGYWASAVSGALPAIPGGNRRLGFWNTLAGIGLAVVGVGLTVVGVVKTVACGLCGVGTILAGVSTFVGGLEALGVDVPFVDGGGFNVNCNGSGCNVSPSGIKLGGVD